MSTPYASGKQSIGQCDRCARMVPLTGLKYQILNQQNTNWLMCVECLDQDQPQYQIGRYPVQDPQALQNARPDSLNDRSVNNAAYAALLAYLNRVQP